MNLNNNVYSGEEMMKRRMRNPGETRRGKAPKPSHARTHQTKLGSLGVYLQNQPAVGLGILIW